MYSVEDPHEIVLEIGKKKVFAIAVLWPGWCRFGKDEPSAIQNLIAAAPRYLKIVKHAKLDFRVPGDSSTLDIVARVQGNTTTDFGAPDIGLPDDWDPVEPDDFERYAKLLKSCWRSFDLSVELAEGKELRKGPRGGGRDLAKIIDHLVGAEEGYLRALGWRIRHDETETDEERIERIRNEVLLGLQAAVDGQIPREGPRGGKRWSPRYFIRRLAWHAVDHTWEIEDRIV